MKEGVSQQDNGADVLDVNVGLPEIHEPSMMEEAVRELQAIIDLPLQIDTSDMEAMERAMRIYNGKPLINSVKRQGRVHDPRLSADGKIRRVAVGLCLDESGIPDTAEGRLAVGRKIIDRAAEYGIGPEDIILDGLCMTVSSDSKGALTTLETLRRIRDELGVGTVLGVSNISFGLPQREIINAAFFTMAMECGLGAAHHKPQLRGHDACLLQLLTRLWTWIPSAASISVCTAARARAWARPSEGGGSQDGTEADHQSGSGEAGASQGPALSAAIERGLKEAAHNAVSALLKEREPLDIINSEMIPALDRVGKGFEKGTVFLPQLLMSAEAAKAAFEVIKAAMDGSGQTQEKKGTIILATVKGDIHDIGKNIVKVLLENYSYEVIDLGRDVPPEAIVKEAVERQVALVGLSALTDHHRAQHGGNHPPVKSCVRHREGDGGRRCADGGLCQDHRR
ncbi:MAG: B12-binding domain-containing protein [Enterocloster clostridioformis]